MTRSFGIVEFKVQEAEFFLDLMINRNNNPNSLELQFLCSAFVSSTRSITFSMQASLKDINGFAEWYSTIQLRLKNDKLANYFHHYRTLNIHTGASMATSGTLIEGKIKHYFTYSRELPDPPEQDVIEACRSYFKTILRIVWECYCQFKQDVDGQFFFTEENFFSMGKTIGDAEESMGYPRGWTDIGDTQATPYRWQLLRENADCCRIIHQFHRWLGEKVVYPPRLPEWAAEKPE